MKFSACGKLLVSLQIVGQFVFLINYFNSKGFCWQGSIDKSMGSAGLL